MTIRAVVAVALALGVCGAVVPLFDDATADRADAAGAREADAVAAAVAALAESDATTGAGARESLAVRLPDGPGTGVAALALGGAPGVDRNRVVAYRISGSDWRVQARLPLLVCGPHDCERPVVLRDDARLVLRLDRTADGTVVRVTAERL